MYIDQVTADWDLAVKLVQAWNDSFDPDDDGDGYQRLSDLMYGGLRRSANAPPAGGVFQEIGGAGNAFGGFGHLGGDLAGSSDVLRSEDRAQVRDQ